MQRIFVNLMCGDPAPRFTAATASNPRYIFDTVAGRHVVLRFFGVTFDPAGKDSGRVQQCLPGVRHCQADSCRVP